MTTLDTAVDRPNTDDRALVLVNHILMLLGFLTSGITSLIGVILAYVRRDGADALARSHYESQIKTFWIGFGLALAGIALLLVLVFPLIGGLSAIDNPDLAGVPTQMVVFASIIGVVALLLLTASFLVPLILSIIGLITLASDQPMGRLRR